MDKGKKYIAIAFIAVLILVVIISITGIIALGNKPEILQGQVEAPEIRISGKLPGRIDEFLVQEGENVMRGDTLVIISSPEVTARYNQVNELGNVAVLENQKVVEGNRKEVVESMRQLWNKTKSDLKLAETTYMRIQSLYNDSVVTAQRRDEAEAVYKAAKAAERAAYQDYKLVADGARTEDKESSLLLVNAAKNTIEEVASLLEDTKLTAPESGQIAVIYPKQGELVGTGTPIMSLIVLEEAHVILNIREDILPSFKMRGRFNGDVPAIDRKNVEFEIYSISPLGSYATWKSTRQSGSYDMRTFEVKARPVDQVADLRPGMSVLVTYAK